MGQLIGRSPFFQIGPPAEVGNANKQVFDFILQHAVGKILDVGGGSGAYAHELMSRGFDVTLAEIDVVRLVQAKNAGLATIDLNEIDLSQISIKYDTILLIEVLEHVEEFENLFKICKDICMEKIILTVPCNDHFDELKNYHLTYHHIAVTDHINHFTSDDMVRLVSANDMLADISWDFYLIPDFFQIMLLDVSHNKLFGKIIRKIFMYGFKLGWIKRKWPTRLNLVATFK